MAELSKSNRIVFNCRTNNCKCFFWVKEFGRVPDSFRLEFYFERGGHKVLELLLRDRLYA